MYTFSFVRNLENQTNYQHQKWNLSVKIDVWTLIDLRESYLTVTRKLRQVQVEIEESTEIEKSVM